MSVPLLMFVVESQSWEGWNGLSGRDQPAIQPPTPWQALLKICLGGWCHFTEIDWTHWHLGGQKGWWQDLDPAPHCGTLFKTFNTLLSEVWYVWICLDLGDHELNYFNYVRDADWIPRWFFVKRLDDWMTLCWDAYTVFLNPVISVLVWNEIQFYIA
jgi:hypothetical protein